jgi:hypothetical protein
MFVTHVIHVFAFLFFLLGAPKFLTVPSDTIAIQDQLAKFECLVDATPKAKITWLLNGKELTNKDNVKFETDAKTSANFLVVPKVTASNFGTYTVKASNSVGEIEHNFKLDVLGNYYAFIFLLLA